MSPVADPRFSQSHRNAARAYDLAEGDRVTRWEYYKPLIMLGGGLAIYAFIALLRGLNDPNTSMVEAFGSVGQAAAGIAISTVIAVPAIVIACKIFEFDAGPILLMLLRLAGIFSVMSVVGVVLMFGGIIGLAAHVLVMAGLVAWLFDVDLAEGLTVTVLAIITHVGISFLMMQ